MNTTIPAPPSVPAPRPECPYEALRLGLGLRLTLSVALAFLAVACGGSPAFKLNPNCVAASVEAGAPAYVCPGVNPIVVTCDRAIETRSDIDPAVGKVSSCTNSTWGDNLACCYAPGEVPTDDD